MAAGLILFALVMLGVLGVPLALAGLYVIAWRQHQLEQRQRVHKPR